MKRSLRLFLVGVAALATATASWAQTSSFEALFLSATGWVRPGETYPMTLRYGVSAGVDSATVSFTLADYTVFVSADPAPSGGDGSAGNPLTWNLAPGLEGKIIVRARALDLNEEPTMIWRDLSAEATLVTSLAGNVVDSISGTTLGPKCTEQVTARYGVRPFPLVMVEYQDISHCTGSGEPFPECTGNHTAEALDTAVNSRTSGASLWQLYQEMSFGQLSPEGQVRPAVGSTEEAWLATQGYPYKWSQLQPSGTCSGTTLAPENGNPGSPDDNPTGFFAIQPNRINDGWYVLPGNQGYYGSDATGHGLVGFVSGGLLLNIDDACGPTGKIAYDAAAIADPDLDYNEFDTDRDGLVDFLNVAFAGEGGNGSIDPTGINNVWPHKSDLQFYFTDENGQRGYVSNDQLRNHVDQPMFWTDATRSEMTTADTGIPVYVRVGPYNVNPESAIEAVSVVAHEYGHSLGLPDFYSLGSRETFGSWELMATDHAQFMSVFNRQEMGWIVPVEAEDGFYTLRESKTDTGEIQWKTAGGVPYTLNGPGIHNADALRVGLPKQLVLEETTSGVRAWHSGAGNDFGCAPEGGHNLDVFLPDLANYSGAGSVELSFQTLYEIEWDWDFAFLLASTDGENWQALPSLEGTTLDNFNPHNWECYDRYGHGITGVSRQAVNERNTLANPDRYPGNYADPEWIQDRFDLTQFAGQALILRFTYFTDPAATKRGWFIDDIAITADGTTVYASDFESREDERLFSSGWTRVSTSTGVDTDHAYFIEMRDRVSFDFDGRGQSDRGTPTWQPGVAVLYTDENHGYGNTGVDNPPAQTIVDSAPQPGNDTPNLDDAAFVTAGSRAIFNGCVHIDNYDNENGSHPDGLWQLPNGMRLTVNSISGLSSDGNATGFAAADVMIDVNPDCSFLELPPTIAFGAGHQDPDPDGSYELTWVRPEAAIGPDLLQEATFLSNLLVDDAEAGMGNWVVDTYTDQCGSAATDFVEWQQNSGKFQSAVFSFFTVATETAYGASCADFHSTMTLAAPVTVPTAGKTVLSFWDSFGGELDDQGFVEVSSNNGATWTALYQTAGPIFADQAIDFAEEPLGYREVELTGFEGADILVRFHYKVGASNYIAYAPIGWWVDDVVISTADWADLAEVDGTSYTRSGLSDGTYHYRVLTRFPGSPLPVDSPWSNVISTDVERVNQAPTAVNDTAMTDEDTAVTIAVLANDSDPDNDPLSVTGVSQPGNGGAVVNGDNTVTYTPNAGFIGTDAFTYSISDGQGGSSSATVSVTVKSTNRDPVAANDFAVTDEDDPVTVAVLANDSDPDGDPLTVVAVSQPANGVAGINPDSTVTYQPNPGFFGTDAFTYTISDGRGGQAHATVSVNVRADGGNGGGGNDDDSDSDSDDADSDGVPNDDDSDDDNDGKHDDDDSDDDGDGVSDEFDTPAKEKKSSRSDTAAPNVSQSYTMVVTDDAAFLAALVEGAGAETLSVEIRDPAGNLAGTSVGVLGRSLVTAVPLGAGDYTVTVTNPGGAAVDYEVTLINRVPWPPLP